VKSVEREVGTPLRGVRRQAGEPSLPFQQTRPDSLRSAKRLLAWLVSLVAALVFLAPLLWMLLASFRAESRIFAFAAGDWFAPGSWTVQNYADAWRRAALGGGLLNSLIQVALIAGVGLLVNSMAAYAFARLEFRGRDALFAAVVVLIILPVEVLAVPMFFTARDLGLTGGFGRAMAGLTAPFFATAFNIYFLRQHFLALPTELEEAAALDGAGVWRQFWSLALPSVKPALATVVLLDVLTHWGDFLWPLMISTREETRTVQLSLANLFTQPPIQWGDILACAVLATLPVIALFRWFQRYIVTTESRAGIK
jgi:multiple sugar transport system permease protein/fructooligosaccharide transport system permease protein